MSKPDGGPAFPLQSDPSAGTDVKMRYSGMSLRDYFAAHAPPLYDMVKIAPDVDSGYMLKMLESIAKWNYSYAATMLAQREKP